MCLHERRYGLSDNIGCAEAQQALALQFLMSLHMSFFPCESCLVSLAMHCVWLLFQQ